MSRKLPLIERPPARLPAPPSDEVVRRVQRLPLRTIDDIRHRFPNIPIDLAERGAHFQSLRLLTTSTCRMRCQYPGEGGLLWCHHEGLERNGLPPADLPTMLRVVEHFRGRYGLTEVVLAGLQPILCDELLRFVRGLRQAGVRKVSLTSHGLDLIDWLPRLQEAGLDALVLSVQGFARHSYRAVMGLDTTTTSPRSSNGSDSRTCGCAFMT